MDELFAAPVDPFSEYAMATEDDDYPKTDFTQLGFTGEIDVPALAESYREALAFVPTFSARLREKRRGPFLVPYWVRTSETPENRLVVEDARHLAGDPFDPMEFSTRFHAARTARRLDLTREAPVTCYLVRVGSEKYIFSILYHHSVIDGRKVTRMLTEMLARYHRRVTGTLPDWTSAPGMTVLARGEAPVRAPSLPSFLREQAAEMRGGGSRVVHIAGSGTPGAIGRHSLRRVIEDGPLMRGLKARARASEATLNELLLAVGRKAISEWNQTRGADHEVLRLMLIANLHGRAAVPEHAGATASAINFLAEGERRDLGALIRFFRDRRIDLFARGIDVANYRLVDRVVWALRPLPLRIRARIIGRIADRIPCTMYLSNVGVLWPRFADGRPTGESRVRGAGRFVIDDMHSSASLCRNIGMGVTVRTHARRFYLNFVLDRFRFTRGEAEDLVAHYCRTLENAA